MDELELLKKDWDKSIKKYPNLSKEEIYNIISKRSSSIVKWIFIISILEFILWTTLSFLGDYSEELEKIQAYDYGFIYYLSLIHISEPTRPY